MARKVSNGRSVRVTAAAAVEAGQFVEVQGFFGLAIQSAAAGQELILNVEQAEYETSQVGDGAFGVGDVVYWDDTEKKLTTTEINRPVGRVTQEKDTSGVIWFQLGPQV